MGVGDQCHVPAVLPRKSPVSNVWEAGWAPWPVWMGDENSPLLGFNPIQPLLLYGCNTWATGINDENKVDIFERKVLRRIC